MKQVKHPRLYEINTAIWLQELSRKYNSSFSVGNIPSEEWDRLEALGFHYVWLMGVWKRSDAGKRYFQSETRNKPHYDSVMRGWKDDDVIGSPYSITSYEPDTIIGTWQDLDSVHDALRKRQIGLILDFVPNHTAPDHPWVTHHTEYYIQGSEDDFERNPAALIPIRYEKETLYIAKGKDPFFPPWPDTAQLNYFNPEMRAAMMKELRRIAGHCDGLRCDMAMLMLNDIFERNWRQAKNHKSFDPMQQEFWVEARNAVPDSILIAEAYWDTEWELQQLGFDYVYDKRLYDRLQNNAASDINLHLMADISFQSKLVRFIENHDEPRSATVFDRGRLISAAVLFATLPGMKLFYHGQIEGRKINAPVFLRRVANEKSDKELRAFYEKLLHITDQDIFINGVWELKEVFSSGDDSFKNLIAYSWKLDGNLRVVVVNITQGTSEGRIPLKKEIDENREYVLYDELNNQRYIRTGNDMIRHGLHIILSGYQGHVFKVS